MLTRTSDIYKIYIKLTIKGLLGNFMSPPPDMTGKASYVFDFETEVARARSMFPKEAANIFFLNVGSGPKEREEICRHITRIYEANGCVINDELKLKLGIIALDLYLKARNGGGAYSKGHHGVLALDTEKSYLGLPRDKDAFARFYHEFAHLAVRGGSNPLDMPKEYDAVLKNAAENVADTFALMIGLHLGVLDTEDVAFCAAMRSFRGMMYDDLVHLTSPNLYQLHDAALIEKFQDMSPKEIARRAFQSRLSGKLQLASFENIRAIYSPERVSHILALDHASIKSMAPEERYALFDEIMVTKPVINAKDDLHKEMARNPGKGIVANILSNPSFCRTIGTYFTEKAARLSPASNEHLFTRAAIRAAEWGARQ